MKRGEKHKRKERACLLYKPVKKHTPPQPTKNTKTEERGGTPESMGVSKLGNKSCEKKKNGCVEGGGAGPQIQKKIPAPGKKEANVCT